MNGRENLHPVLSDRALGKGLSTRARGRFTKGVRPGCVTGTRHPGAGSRREEEQPGVGAPDSPVLHGGEGALVGHVVHQHEAHGPSVVGGGDGAVPLLAGRVLKTATKISFN